MCLFVHRIHPQQVLPEARPSQQLHDPQPQSFPRFVQPRLAQVVGQQVTGKLQGLGTLIR